TIVDAVSGAVAVYTGPEGLPGLAPVLGILLALLTAGIIFGGMRRVADVAQNMVPIMAALYLLIGIIIVGMNFSELPRVLGQIVVEAFNPQAVIGGGLGDRKSTRLNSSHVSISYAVFCLKKKKND